MVNNMAKFKGRKGAVDTQKKRFRRFKIAEMTTDTVSSSAISA